MYHGGKKGRTHAVSATVKGMYHILQICIRSMYQGENNLLRLRKIFMYKTYVLPFYDFMYHKTYNLLILNKIYMYNFKKVL